ncbi:MAG: MFS transporter [Fervidicoccaceae archaeon]
MSEDGVRISGTQRRALIAGTTAFFGGFAAVALFNITAKTLSETLNLSLLQIGWLVAIPTLTGSLMRIPFGAMVDRYGGRRIILLQLLLALIGMIGLLLSIGAIMNRSITSSTLGYALLMFFGAVAGIGISVFSSGIAYVSYWFPQRKQGYALGFYAGIGNTAPGIFTGILPYAVASLGLLGSYAAWMLILIVVILIFFFTGKDPYYFQLLKKYNRERAIEEARKLGQELIPTGSARESLMKASKLFRTWIFVILYFTSFGGFLALTSWLPTYWQKLFSLPSSQAGLISGILFSLLASLIRVAGGWTSDRAGGERVAVLSFTVILLGSTIMMLSASFSICLVGILVLAFGMGFANASTFKMIPKYVPEAIGGATGWVGGLGALGGLLLPPAMAWFAQEFGTRGYSLGFSTFVVLSAISLILSFMVFKLARK